MTDPPRAARAIEIVPEEQYLNVVSPVKALSYEEADAKIREGADSFSFKAAQDRLGRVDVVSLEAKTPSEDQWDIGVVRGADGLDTLHAGIYDGHGGAETSQFLRKNLVPYVANALASKRNGPRIVEDCIERAFVGLDNCMLNIAETALKAGHSAGAAELRVAIEPVFTGSCALLTTYDASSKTLYTALSGDSRAIRAQWSDESDKPVVDVLSKEQNTCDQQEFDRISAEHPDEDDIMNPVRGTMLDIGVTRAFGNARWKWPAELVMQARNRCHGPKPLPKVKTPPYMTACPVVTTRTVDARDFVILGSDGLWEQISNEDAVECVSRWAAARRLGRPEPVVESHESRYEISDDGALCRAARPEDFAIEDLDNAAVCLLKNVLGGRHKYMVAGALTANPPIRRFVRDDITVQVIFFSSP